jgi:membrane-associated protein
VFPGEAKAGVSAASGETKAWVSAAAKAGVSAAARAGVPGPAKARVCWIPPEPCRGFRQCRGYGREPAGRSGREADRVSSITTDLAGLSGTVALLLIAALVFGETAVFLGFVIPGETAAVLGGVLASRGRVSLPLLIIVVVAAAVTGPLIGYEIGRHLGGRVIAARRMRRVAGGMDRAQAVLHRRGGLAVLLGRFVAILRALMPAVAGTTRMPYRTFLIYNMLGGLIWGIGYCLLGYAAGSAYAAIERTVGTGVAIVVAVVVLGGVGFWLVRRHRRGQADPDAVRAGGPDTAGPDAAGPDVVRPASPDVVRPPGPERPC